MKKNNKIEFNQSFSSQNTRIYIDEVLKGKHVSGDGKYTKLCHDYIEKQFNVKKALLVHSGTAALEMQAILSDIQPGDEVIMPSYTFVSTANAFVLRGGVPVFVDVREDTLNIDETLIEEAVTEKTKAIVPVHYAGVSCEMDTILSISKRHNLMLFEDAAQGIGSTYKGRMLGSIGDIGAFSFHETKNIMSGEGGAVLINNESLCERAEIIREKGTNRSKFFRGQVDKYTWVDVGSSYLPGELIAAYLYSTLELFPQVMEKRRALWQRYYDAFKVWESVGVLKCPVIPEECVHNGHMFYMLLRDLETRTQLINHFKKNNILSVFHYIPLHNSPAGEKYARYTGDMSVTNSISDRVLRLPLYFDLDFDEQDRIIETAESFLKNMV